LWTSLWNSKPPAERISYVDLIKFGGNVLGESGGNLGGNLCWLWRSRILNYDRHCRIFRRWICSVLRRLNKRCVGRSGRDVYVDLMSSEKCLDEGVWKWFKSSKDGTGEVDQLVQTFARATPAQGTNGTRRCAE
jgi:hypothetical protein